LTQVRIKTAVSVFGPSIDLPMIEFVAPAEYKDFLEGMLP
jgi:hypothetical protein